MSLCGKLICVLKTARFDKILDEIDQGKGSYELQCVNSTPWAPVFDDAFKTIHFSADTSL